MPREGLEQATPRMTKTNFDRYLEQQLEDPEFAKGFERAGKEWDQALETTGPRPHAGEKRQGSR